MNFRAIPRVLVALGLGVVASFSAHADDPVNGAALYASQCASCHGSSPLTSNSNKIYNGRNARSVIDAGITSVGDMNSLRAAFPAGGAALADLAAYLGNTPSTLAFASTAVGATSATRTLTVYASLKAGQALSALSTSTTGDFSRVGGTCGTAVATGTSCTVLLAFSPTASGSRVGALSVTHNKTLTPISIALSGTATGAATAAPIATFAPTSLTLAATAIGATSAAQNVTLSNTGNASLSITSMASSDPANFVIAGGTCGAGGSVAAGASCTVSVAFAPAPGATGVRGGSLSIVHNASGSPGVMGLSGTATAAAAPAALLTASIAFGSVNVGTTGSVQTATLTNNGTAPLTIGTVLTGSAEFSLGGGTCSAGGTLAVAGSCTVNLAFAPAAAGARSGTLTVTHNASGGQSTTSLAGTGVALSPVIGLSPATLSFSQTVNTASMAQTLTVSNSGNAPLAIHTLSIGGAQAAAFQWAAGTTCVAGGSVAANGSCVVKMVFTPTTPGAHSASLSLTHSAAGSPGSVTLNGTGTASAQPAISLNATALTFPSQTLGSASAAQVVTVSNSGAAPLTFSGLGLTGTAASEFTRSGSCTATGTLAAGASCTLGISFTPGAAGTRSATLSLVSDAANGGAALSLSGTGVAAAAPAVTLSPATLAFGNQSVGSPSTVRTASLTNSGSGALALSGVAATAGFGVSHTCGASLAAGASCVLSVSFTPTAEGAASGSVNVVSNAAGSPHTLALTGTGVAASPVLAWAPATPTLAFGDVSLGGTPAARVLTLSNQGPGAVTLTQLTLAGAQAADFSLGGVGTCALNSPLAPGGACTVALSFQPGAVGARGATLQVVSSGSNPPDVALSGTGSGLAQPALGVVPPGLSFTVAPTATAESQALALQNHGNAVLRVTGLRVVSGSFTLGAAALNGCADTPFDLMPGQGCALAVGWSGTASGAEAGALEIDTSAAATPTQVTLQGVRESSTTAVTPALSNVGAGGCSIAQGGSLLDPTLWLLALAALGVLWLRRTGR